MSDGHRPAGRLVLHPDTRSVTLDGRTVRLSRKEFQVLALLVAEPDTVHTVVELARRVWDFLLLPGAEPAVEVEVARIRAKLGFPAFLRGGRDEGYRFVSSALHEAGPAHAEGAGPE
ncbi:winged helix-turn-helix domain-containing protein [Streptomyces sp. NPDC004752]